MANKHEVRVRRAYDEPAPEDGAGCWSTASGPEG